MTLPEKLKKEFTLKRSLIATGCASALYLMPPYIQDAPEKFNDLFQKTPEISFTEFLSASQSGVYEHAIIQGNKILLTARTNKSEFVVTIPENLEWNDILGFFEQGTANKTTVSFKQDGSAISAFIEDVNKHTADHLPLILALASLYFAYNEYNRAKNFKHYVSRVTEEEALKETAYHEAGHALMMLLKPGPWELAKATVEPNAGYLGAVSFGPRKKYKTTTKEMLRNEIMISLAGKCAEAITFGKDAFTIGITGDLKNARETATSMVRHFGMSNNLGPVHYSNVGDYLPSWIGSLGLSEAKRTQIEQEVEDLLKECENEAMLALTANKEKLDIIANLLITKRTVSPEEIREAAGFTEPENPEPEPSS